MSSKSRFATGALFLLVLASQHPAAQNCGCSLTQSAGLGSVRHIKWRIETNDNIVISLFEERVVAAAAIWNDEFGRRGTQASLQKGTGDIRIYVDKNRPSNNHYWDGPTKTLVFASADWKDPSAPNDYIIAALAHELGHSLGFEQNNCPGESLMSDTNRSSYRTAFTDCDNTNLTPHLGAPTRRDDDVDGYSPDDPPGSEWWDCDDTNPDVGNECPGDGNGDEEDQCSDPVECNQSPIILPLSKAQAFKLTSVGEGVHFDLNNDGRPERTAWTAPGSKLAFLAIDRNGDGAITNGSELFGNYTLPEVNDGFTALRRLMDQSSVDVEQGGLGRIDGNDPIWPHLLLWEDRNHNGVSEPGELRSFSEVYQAIGTDYHLHNRRDGHGNLFRYRGWAQSAPAGGGKRRDVYDVFLVAAGR